MFYRRRFSRVASDILRRCGYTDEGMLTFWPAGASLLFVALGKREGLAPAETAALGVMQVAAYHFREKQLSADETTKIGAVVIRAATDLKVRRSVLDRIIDLMPPNSPPPAAPPPTTPGPWG